MLLLLSSLISSLAMTVAQAQAAPKIVSVDKQSIKMLLLDYGPELEQEPPNREAKSVFPSVDISKTLIASPAEFASVNVGSGLAISVVGLNHFYVITRLYSGGYQVLRLDVGSCSLDQVSKWIKQEKEGYYPQDVPIEGKPYTLNINFKLPNGQMVNANAMEVSSIGNNDELTCK